MWSSVDLFQISPDTTQSTYQVFPLGLSHLILVSAANGWKFSCFWLFQPFIFEFSFCGILRESLRSDVVGTWDINPTKLFPPLFPCTCQFSTIQLIKRWKTFPRPRLRFSHSTDERKKLWKSPWKTFATDVKRFSREKKNNNRVENVKN